MIAFIKKRPGACTVVAVAMFVAGGAVARHGGKSGKSGKKGRDLQRAAAAKPEVRAPARPARASWRDQIDLSRARLEGGRLEQVLQDGTRLRFTLDPDLQQWATAYLRKYNLPYGAMF